MKVRIAIIAMLFSVSIFGQTKAIWAQEMPTEYQQVLKTVRNSGGYKSNVLKVNIPRTGDIAMLEGEVTPTLKALHSHGLDVVAIHNHMIETQPIIIFLHYWGRGPARQLAQGFKAALDQLGKGDK